MPSTLVDRKFLRCLPSDGVATLGADRRDAVQLGTRLGRHNQRYDSRRLTISVGAGVDHTRLIP